MQTEKWDHALLDGKYAGTVQQDGESRSLVQFAGPNATYEQDWYENARLTVTARRRARALGNEAEQGISLY